MTQNVPNLQWVPTSDNTGYVALVQVDFSVDPNWQIAANGTASQETPIDIIPQYVILDNLANGEQALLTFGPFSYSVPAFTRKTFAVPTNQTIFNVSAGNGNTGKVNVYFLDSSKFSSDDADLLAIYEAAALGAIKFPFVVYNATNSNQQKSDQAMTVELLGTSAPLNYFLLPILGTPVENGFFSLIYNNGTQVANLTPSGGDTINGVFGFGNPFQLYPNEAGILSSDGSQWFFRYLSSKTPGVSNSAASVTQSYNDVGKRMEFAGSTSQTYNLLAVSTFDNGDFIDVANNTTAHILQIVPNGVDTINGSNNPFSVYAGQTGRLQKDASGEWGWYPNNAGPGGTVVGGGIGTIAGGVLTVKDTWGAVTGFTRTGGGQYSVTTNLNGANFFCCPSVVNGGARGLPVGGSYGTGVNPTFTIEVLDAGGGGGVDPTAIAFTIIGR